MKKKNMCNQTFLIIVYIAIMLRFFHSFDPELQLVNTKAMLKNKLKELLNELKMFIVQVILVLHYKKRNNWKIFHCCTKLIASDSDIDSEIFKC